MAMSLTYKELENRRRGRYGRGRDTPDLGCLCEALNAAPARLVADLNPIARKSLVQPAVSQQDDLLTRVIAMKKSLTIFLILMLGTAKLLAYDFSYSYIAGINQIKNFGEVISSAVNKIRCKDFSEFREGCKNMKYYLLEPVL